MAALLRRPIWISILTDFLCAYVVVQPCFNYHFFMKLSVRLCTLIVAFKLSLSALQVSTRFMCNPDYLTIAVHQEPSVADLFYCCRVLGLHVIEFCPTATVVSFSRAQVNDFTWFAFELALLMRTTHGLPPGILIFPHASFFHCGFFSCAVVFFPPMLSLYSPCVSCPCQSFTQPPPSALPWAPSFLHLYCDFLPTSNVPVCHEGTQPPE